LNKKLSPRLLTMAGFVAPGESVADIGTDHAYLPRYLVANGISPFAILTDMKIGPLRMAWRSVCIELGSDEAFLPGRRTGGYELRLGDGLAPLSAGEADAVVVAGMGGETIAEILAADPAKSGSFGKYILQPRTKADALRTWLNGAGWRTFAETAAEEKGRMCTIIVAAPGGAPGCAGDTQEV
jgi:tRNA (adenine22-N1)-methyltransferase